jgi:preprotein translocase subunit SecF
MEIIKPGRYFDFMALRGYFLALSAVLILGSLFAIFVYPKPRFGTDFMGGTEIEVVFQKELGPTEIRGAVEQAGFTSPDVVRITDSNFDHHFMIRVQEVSSISEEQERRIQTALCIPPDDVPIPEAECPPHMRPTEIKFSPGGDKISLRYENKEPDLAALQSKFEAAGGTDLQLRKGKESVVQEDDRVELRLKSKGDQLMDGLRDNLGPDVVPASPVRLEWIGPKAGAQLRDAAIKSIIITLFFIMAYVAFRFDMRFAPGGIVALIHDSLIAAGAMVITQRDINLSTIAAILTIVGYSINDTVVVFDRIRENLGKHRGMSFSKIINVSVSEVLGRTLMTAATTCIALASFLYFGTGVLKDFAFTLLVGVVVGTYSSIYLAAPVTEWIDRRFFGAKVATANRKVRRKRVQKRAETVV